MCHTSACLKTKGFCVLIINRYDEFLKDAFLIINLCTYIEKIDLKKLAFVGKSVRFYKV